VSPTVDPKKDAEIDACLDRLNKALPKVTKVNGAAKHPDKTRRTQALKAFQRDPTLIESQDESEEDLESEPEPSSASKS